MNRNLPLYGLTFALLIGIVFEQFGPLKMGDASPIPLLMALLFNELALIVCLVSGYVSMKSLYQGQSKARNVFYSIAAVLMSVHFIIIGLQLWDAANPVNS